MATLAPQRVCRDLADSSLATLEPIQGADVEADGAGDARVASLPRPTVFLF